MDSEETKAPFLEKTVNDEDEKFVYHIDADKVMTALGKYARYQIFCVALINFSWWIMAIEVMVMAFATEVPPIRCEIENSTGVWNLSAPISIDFCSKNTSESSCKNITFDKSFGETIVSEWHMICDKTHFVHFSTSLFMIGGMISTLGITQLSDRYGRRRVFLITCWISSVLGILSSFSPSFPLFLLARFIMGLAAPGLGAVSWVYSCEIIAPQFRSFMPLIGNALWTMAYCSVGLVAIYFPNWRNLVLVTAVPSVLSFGFYWFLPETLYWLVAKGKTEEAHDWIERMKTLNGAKVDVKKCLIKREIDYKQPKRHLGHAFKSGVLTFHMIIFCFIMITGSLVYWGLSLFSTNLSEDRYTGFILSGLIEFPAGIIGPLLLLCFGRRTVGVGSFALSGFALVLLVFVPTDAPSWITMALALTGKFGNMIIWSSTDILLPEMLPTTVRNVTYGLISTVSKIGSVCAPYAGVLAKIDARLPPAVFGIMSLIAAFLHFCFPETRGKELPEDIEDTERGPFLHFVLKERNCKYVTQF